MRRQRVFMCQKASGFGSTTTPSAPVSVRPGRGSPSCDLSRTPVADRQAPRHGRQVRDRAARDAGAPAEARRDRDDHELLAERSRSRPAAARTHGGIHAGRHRRLPGDRTVHPATPIADPTGGYVYAARPDGKMHKLVLGHRSASPHRGLAGHRDPRSHPRKDTSALNLSEGSLIVVADGYVGDTPPYQGQW